MGALDPPEVQEWSTDGLYQLDAIADSGSIIGVGGTLNPGFKVVSILYAAPGNGSQNGFTNSTTNGTSTSIADSLGYSVTDTFSTGQADIWSASVSSGFSSTTGSSEQFTESFTNGQTIANKTAGSSPNTVDHNQDTLMVWLNPQVNFKQELANPNSVSYSIASQVLQGGTAQFDYVLVTAKTLQPDANGNSSVDPAILNHQYDSDTMLNDLPGLASLCANLDLTAYNNNQCTLSGQCGCKASDFKHILDADPLINPINPSLDLSTAIDPTSVTSSGSQVCSALSPAPSSSAMCRYVAVPAVQGGSVQATQILSGPQCSGCGTNPTTFTQTDQNVQSTTFTETQEQTAGTSVKVGPIFANFTVATTWKWTESESSGSSTGTANSLSFSLSSSTPYCYQPVRVFEDTVFHTFVLQQAPGNTTCP